MHLCSERAYISKANIDLFGKAQMRLAPREDYGFSVLLVHGAGSFACSRVSVLSSMMN